MKNCLLSAAASGAFWLILLFVVCFLAVHTVRLARIGWNYQKRRGTASPEKAPADKRGPDPARRDPPAKETPEASAGEKPAPEPVYYIVERKKRRPRETYSPPKEIKFK